MGTETVQALANLGAPTIILIFAIKEYFAWQKSKKEGNGNGHKNGNGKQVEIDVAVMKQRLDTIENNHLHHLKEEIDKQTKWMEKHDDEHRVEREVLWQIAYSMGIRKLPEKPQ